ncbi:hypothetical protein D9757_013777 [Collybiopsis confluens]|uniref:JmjC domain-containing protein n=1 Tax=Collybiopsis confluens TaxID=2823264 RepID=A0A8H5GI15_9AGAR|nr:hypothetical protein D9757_013777 [Collybiopsis confluens]
MAEKEPIQDFSVMLSLPLFANLVDRRLQGAESLCPEHDIAMLNAALQKTWEKKLTADSQWKELLALSTAEQVEKESWSWPSHLGPILGFKLHHILSGGGTLARTIPRKPMAEQLSSRLRRVAKQMVQKPGWPTIIEEAVFARWSHHGSNPTLPSTLAVPSSSCDSGDAAHSLARSVLLNLSGIHQNAKAKQYANIVTNIELAAAYLGVMTLGAVDGDTDGEIADLLTRKLRLVNALPGASEVSDILQEANLPLVEFQAPLFSALAISPLLLFRTCLLHSSRFGCSHYVSFLLTLGDMKPESLRSIETYIWRNLSLVSRRQLTPEAMIDLVLDSVISPKVTATFLSEDTKFKKDLRKHFSSFFDEERDDTLFFFPNVTTIIKTDVPSGHLEDISHAPNSKTGRPISFHSELELPEISGSNKARGSSSMSTFSHSLPSPAPTPSRTSGNTGASHRETDNEPDRTTIPPVTSSQTHGLSVVPPATPLPGCNQGSMRTIQTLLPRMIDPYSTRTPPPAPTSAQSPNPVSKQCSSDSPSPSDSTYPQETCAEVPTVLDPVTAVRDEHPRSKTSAEGLGPRPPSSGTDISVSDSHEEPQSTATGGSPLDSGSIAKADNSAEGCAINPPNATTMDPNHTQVESTGGKQSPTVNTPSPTAKRSQDISVHVTRNDHDNEMDVDSEFSTASTSTSKSQDNISVENASPGECSAKNPVRITSNDHDEAMDVNSEKCPDKDEHSQQSPAMKPPSTADAEPSPKLDLPENSASADYLNTLLYARPILRARSESPSPLRNLPLSSFSFDFKSPSSHSPPLPGSSFGGPFFSLQNRPTTPSSQINITPSVNSDSINSSKLPQSSDRDEAMDVESQKCPDSAEHSDQSPPIKAPSASDPQPSLTSENSVTADYLNTSLHPRPIPRTRSESPSPLHRILRSSSLDFRPPPDQPPPASGFSPSDRLFNLRNQRNTSSSQSTVAPSVDPDSIDPLATDLTSQTRLLTRDSTPEVISSVDPSLINSPEPPDNIQDAKTGDDGDNNENVGGNSDHSHEADGENETVVLRKSDQIAKRKLCESESDSGGDSKRLKLNSHLRKRKPKSKKTPSRRDNAGDAAPYDDDDDDESGDHGSAKASASTPGIPVDEEDIDHGVPSLQLEEKLTRHQWKLPIDVYSADGRKYYRHYGSHYLGRRTCLARLDAHIIKFPNFETDQLNLAAHVEQWRSSVGPPSQWLPDSELLNIQPHSSTSHPDAHPIYTADYFKFYKMSTSTVQGLLRQYPVIVLSGRPMRLTCDRAGLEEFGDLSRIRIMHGKCLTYPFGHQNLIGYVDASKFNEDEADAVYSRATYKDFLSTNKIVNSLHNPMGGDVPALPQLATDLRAASMIFPGFLTDFHVHLMTWGLLAKTNAIHDPHVDCTGMCSWIAIEDGMKKWDFAFAPDPAKAAATESFGYDVTLKRNFEHGWRWFSILLSPGSMVIMRPGVVHSVTTLKDCVACNSIYHTFVNSSTITNGAIDNKQFNLLRIFLYWFRIMCGGGSSYLNNIHTDSGKISAHVPNVLDPNGFENVLALMVYTELVGALSPASYSQPRPANFHNESFQLPCIRAKELWLWLEKHFVLTMENEDSVLDQTMADFFLKILLQHSHKLWYDVKERSKRGSMGATCVREGVICEINAPDVYQEVAKISVVPGFSKLWAAEIQKTTPELYAFPSGATGGRYVVRRKE